MPVSTSIVPLSDTVGSVRQSLPSHESDLFQFSGMSVPGLVFDWFGADIHSSAFSSRFTPTPLLYRPSLLFFWSVSSPNDWNNALQYKHIYEEAYRKFNELTQELDFQLAPFQHAHRNDNYLIKL